MTVTVIDKSTIFNTLSNSYIILCDIDHINNDIVNIKYDDNCYEFITVCYDIAKNASNSIELASAAIKCNYIELLYQYSTENIDDVYENKILFLDLHKPYDNIKRFIDTYYSLMHNVDIFVIGILPDIIDKIVTKYDANNKLYICR